MLIEFEITKAENAGRYRRPYVAVWIADKDGFPVKTLLLFLMKNQPGPRWHRDLRRWYADEVAKLEVAEFLRAEHHRTGIVSDFLAFQDQCEVTFEGGLPLAVTLGSILAIWYSGL